MSVAALPPLTLLLWLLGLTSLLHAGLALSGISHDLVVKTNKGRIQGFQSTISLNGTSVLVNGSWQLLGKRVSAWYGVPYAQPPLGNLRFRHPLPIESWEGVKETLEQPNSCVQSRDEMWPGFHGSEQWNANTDLSEDCLYLNVVVPRPHPKNAEVIIWIHGGGFYSGTTTLDLYDLRTMAAEENIIMVGIQYRVASLAFLYLDTNDVPGNAGMFDQLMALQWVKDNIEQFGGNPSNITLMGGSAGACSVSLHLLSPLSRHLFSQAVMQSGSATVPWGVITKEESLLRGLRLAELMGCPHDRENISRSIDCLRKANATEMVDKDWDVITTEKNVITDNRQIVSGAFTPIIDGSFLIEKPSVSLEKKEFKKTNILIGANKDEGMIFIFYYLPDIFPTKEDVFINREDFSRSIAELNAFTRPLQRKAIEFEYTNWMNPRDPIKNRQEVDRLTGDRQFTCPVVEFAHRYAETQNVYMYHFSQRPTNSPWPAWSGALQGDEIAFVFGRPLNRSKGYSEAEVRLSKKMMTYWANFAKTGNPSLSADRTWTDTYWPLHTPLKRETLNLNADRTDVLEGYRVNKCAFWSNFLPQLAIDPIPQPAQCGPDCCTTSTTTTSWSLWPLTAFTASQLDPTDTKTSTATWFSWWDQN